MCTYLFTCQFVSRLLTLSLINSCVWRASYIILERSNTPKTRGKEGSGVGRVRAGSIVSVYQSEELKGTFGLSDGMQNTVTGNRGEGDQVDR